MGGGNCLFGTEITEDKTTPLFRGNVSIVEVASVDTNPTKLPDVEPIQAGKIDTATARCFDLFCVGKYEQGSDLKLNIQPAKKIPNLVTKDESGDLAFVEPAPMCTIRAPKGHSVWVNVELKTITTEVSKYMCLGIKKRGEEDYYDILCTRNLSRYVDVLETDTVELVPLVSSTELPTYTPVKAAETAKIADDVNTYDFGAVYRVCISLYEGQWVTNQKNNAMSVFNSHWNNYSGIGMGPVTDQDGNTHLDQLFAVAQNGVLARSPDGIHWFENGRVFGSSRGTVYGNGIWCVVNGGGEIIRSVSGGRSWSDTLVTMSVNKIGFGNNIFMAVLTDGLVYTSPDAEIWTQVGKIGMSDSSVWGILLYGNGMWIYCTGTGYVHSSKDDGKSWGGPSDKLRQLCPRIAWCGGSFANGYFYVIYQGELIAVSQDGENWNPILRLSGTYQNVTYFKNKIWTYDVTGSTGHIGLPRPDGTIDFYSVV